ncbi:DUF3344 domain-containing protein [Streptomyces meridianus]|uniref:DUF3344 domain-containing protein n=1 Tax=Streptomyces meridianus TaxID=2938945 RepID=A0ABT0X6T3_9ACTN|nr:DUF3344 domain-containing protein [Streptomyces meridianus]MCM2578233.1 DUF3344 domain-containing protein [Streptomyces meridianus]
MRVSLGRKSRGALCAVSSLVAVLALPQYVAVPDEREALQAAAPPGEAAVRDDSARTTGDAGKGEAKRIPFTQRFRAVQHGGIARAANSVATCESEKRQAKVSCSQAQSGGTGANGDYEMTYVDVDDDPNTYNSSRADLHLPENATVTYARLYWGGNLRVGEQKPEKDNGRVLFAEPGGSYKEVLADTTVGHRTTGSTDSYAASADVTGIVRDSRNGAYTVGQLNVAKGHSPAGAWGGWTLVVAYAHREAPLRELAIWDGFDSVTSPRSGRSVGIGGLDVPAGSNGSLGVVAYDGDRGPGGESLSAAMGKASPVALSDGANPAGDPMNSTISDHGRIEERREPAFRNTLGFDSDIFDLRRALTKGGRKMTVRFNAEGDGYHLGALFLQTDARR